MQTILVTGGAGFIGSNLVHTLLQRGCRVINVDKLTYAGNLASLADLAGHPDYFFKQVDLVDTGRLASVFEEYRPAAVMHLAAESHVDRSIDAPGRFIQTNVVGTFELLQQSLAYWRSLPAAAASEPVGSPSQQQFRFLHVSTDEVYGALSANATGFSERTAYDPHSPYSASKAASDHLVRAWHHTYGLPVLLTNCSNNYGPYQFPEKLIPVVVLKCLRQEPIPVYGTGENVRDWLYVSDHVDALYTVLTKGRIGETYNIGGHCERKNIELVTILCRLMDEMHPSGLRTVTDFAGKALQSPLRSYEELITFVTDRPGHDQRYAIDASKLCKELGWFPKEDFESGLRKTVRWYLDHRDWWEAILKA
ncbi:dTDP-glucose 4,6-dehydratase [Coraliomargarita sp. SDUM461004]|uniref:dTDP-glucose 4,6-dehydratase n=1 Tax=Thalassobacterium sedimentorum TaxID=3041258 RepID=A0ABU1AKB2_9BACT|nr:dTDP-glucose 4,6-dehydratase [Coraliomargarita sp. SDUM461004]MDQ8195223.1 dTDP-glucose 4,6-dehydratase [Coraliomargarita sp. SDUM461004]